MLTYPTPITLSLNCRKTEGQTVSVAFIETVSGQIEILYVLTVMN